MVTLESATLFIVETYEVAAPQYPHIILQNVTPTLKNVYFAMCEIDCIDFECFHDNLKNMVQILLCFTCLITLLPNILLGFGSEN